MRAVNNEQALDKYSMWRASVDRRRISATIRVKSDGEVTQGLMEQDQVVMGLQSKSLLQS